MFRFDYPKSLIYLAVIFLAPNKTGILIYNLLVLNPVRVDPFPWAQILLSEAGVLQSQTGDYGAL